MKDSIVLNETQYAELAGLDIGPRVRYIREILHENFGPSFSGNSVANRIKIISQPTLTHIERGKSKDVPSKVLRAISRDFNVNMDIFFDDFYEGEYKPIVIHRKHDEQPDNVSTLIDDAYIPIDINPFTENEFILVVYAQLESSNGDRKLLFNTRSKEKYSIPYLRHVIAQFINALETTDSLINPEHLPLTDGVSAVALADRHIKVRDLPMYDIWFPKSEWESMFNNLNKVGEKYTARLLEHLNGKKETANLNQNDDIRKLSRRK
ncbi:helix-turn-helix domain-containing protein [Brevibacillus humidisoli]|uniref:helix-turn-helix domain-containing protein n=1 Tax=Brevibacillus humidisoli TaxID=2895522 RepID=UPI001E58A3E3|nr:helix-turn-helix domain-containing protein [Brevibacillus humidisoli]UFJ41711.1 helix-turn-helix domain-containing protein [Brevibacillus humidisoli]